MAELKLGPFDELPQLRTYTTLLLGFPLPDATKRNNIILNLQGATDTLVGCFPFLAGQVSLSEASEECLNASKHIPAKVEYQCKITVNYAPEDFPSYGEIVAAEAPATMLDGKIVGQGDGYPTKITGNTTSPCLGIRANFIKGGLLLTFALLHTIGDGTSLGQVIKMFATACRGDDIPVPELRAGNVDRQTSIPSLRPDQGSLDHSYLFLKKVRESEQASQETAIDASDSPAMRWAYFSISRDKIIELKAEALANQGMAEGNVPVSTNDAVTALIWRAITIARMPRLQLSETTTLLRAINLRRKFKPPLPAANVQNVVGATYTNFELEGFSAIPLATLAAALRKDLQEINDHHARSMFTLLRSIRDKSTINFGANFTANDITVSSFTSLPLYTSNFGPLLGKPEFVRRPNLTPTDGLVYIMPTRPDGGMDVAISIRVDDMERMHKDEKWTFYTHYIG